MLAAGIVAPVNSPGSLTIIGDLTLAASSSMELEIAGNNLFDTLHVSGLATLGGTLSVTLLDGFLASDGEIFVMLTSGEGMQDAFDNVASGDRLDVGPGSFLVTYGDGQLALSDFQPVPEPSALVLAGIGLAGVGLALTRRQKKRPPQQVA